MTFPKQTFTIRDPGIVSAAPTSNPPLFTGIATGGSVALETVASISDITKVRAEVGYGPLAEDIALALQKRGGPILYVKHDSADSKTLTAQALTKLVGSGPTVTVSGTPNDRYALRVEVILGGAVGTATFRYSLDAHDADANPFTYSRVRVTASTYAVPNSGLTLAFPAGTYVAGDVYTLACVPQEPGTADLADVATALLAATSRLFYLWTVSGAQPTHTAGSAMAAALSGHLSSLATQNRFARGLIDVGSDATKTQVITEAAGWTSSRICPAYGYELRLSALPFEGFALRKTSFVSDLAVRATQELISSDLSRTAAGALDGVRKIFFDGFADNGLDDVKISTPRTWPAIDGFWIANAKLHSDFGSDFTDLQYGRVIDIASRTTFVAQFPYQSASVRTIGAAEATDERPAGAIDEKDAKTIETAVQSALDANLKEPLNANGTNGHVSEVVYGVDLSVNITLTQQLVTTVAVRPLGYAKLISTTLFFTLSI
jgi:hypothetical protein